ncbi:MarR family transcriptional regulator [Nocardioides humilatus]|uniref:MarR family transcriptional regulator n=1 Tax=Nocardioides humilatus TaxID=2607660 RepID=A0A5B1LIH3_9ACTN|nr:MarR family transcriptional regulator [Nocardioides humilatus]KAA1419387.1 MarR family transcriptional regulator [Nocardioides humilatus]
MGADLDTERTDTLRHLEQEVGVLVRRVRRIIGVRAVAVHPDLQGVSYLILGYLAQHSPMRASGLCTVFDMDKGAVSRQVQHLVDLGLVDRTPDPADGRATLITVSEEGTRRLGDVAQHRRKLLAERLGDWSADDLDQLGVLLSRYNAALADD